jgi:predicted nucleic acid-binding protein
MTFDTLLPGDSVFVDANIFIYHFNGISSQCKHFLSRCTSQDIAGYSSAFVLAEVLHRLMIAEAIRKNYIRAKNPLKQFKKHPEIIAQLTDYSADVATIHDMNITIIPLTEQHILESEAVRKSERILTNDSLILAVMKHANLTKLATNDRDFDRVAWLNVYAPTDI